MTNLNTTDTKNDTTEDKENINMTDATTTTQTVPYPSPSTHSAENEENIDMTDTTTSAGDGDQTAPNSIAKRILDQDRESREALKILLDDALAGAGSRRLPVLTAKMAETTSYLATVDLEWLQTKLRFAKDLPLFRNKLNDAGELEIDEKTIDEIVQRPLDYTRQLPLTIYLAGREHHKFPVILVVLTDDWVDDPLHENWERTGDNPNMWRAKRDVTSFEALDGHDIFGLLDIDELYLFALDGQHRLLGVQGLMDLIKNRRISKRKKHNGEATSVSYSLDDLAETYGFTASGIDRLAHERIGIEILPAVKKGETREAARRRVKSVFTHVNKHATVLTAGQVAQLDEDDGFSIVARGAAVSHDLLRMTPNRDKNPRVNWQNSNIANRSTVLTTLQTLKEMTTGYLGARAPYDKWKTDDKLKDLVPVRPDEHELQQGSDEFAVFLDWFATLPSMAELDRGATTRDFRLFTTEVVNEGPPEVKGKAHMLFRPVGQIVLARAIGTLVAKGRSLDDLFKMLADYESEGGFALDNTQNPWWGVLYDPVGNKIARGGEDLSTDILIYLLGGMADDQGARDKLCVRLAEARTVRDGSPEEDKPVGFDGSRINPEDFRLPKML